MQGFSAAPSSSLADRVLCEVSHIGAGRDCRHVLPAIYAGTSDRHTCSPPPGDPAIETGRISIAADRPARAPRCGQRDPIAAHTSARRGHDTGKAIGPGGQGRQDTPVPAGGHVKPLPQSLQVRRAAKPRRIGLLRGDLDVTDKNCQRPSGRARTDTARQSQSHPD